ncbi:polyribonucleotide nucleotidyltransferase [Candidatus Kuenenbacteria bacterium RIFCSPLOWO2_12_FULL_42_13]|uniref:Polyribonucleotide nucleotidyltransferase n=2 Tax=Candidatus Kueneniibacteriota TaxID=1752740 RepID=A0A1F6G1A2_9BACT|nr:MAG: polyribonucleotide nucleotidyltransferase [Candidatus Kuenenbacteria bacterium RIFCSPHIGHO2_02_FULL_42_29]OGG91902.1 MAG: polyribonucleotide nucleotidyltransferase [Candidatus Kuenenbacteria bacterium RIFCSPLOWO2_12_FULL_42_13]OGG98520.1 MAG: polyribonucleotide nucleotidyltransferase [Candidatus Kuenenbacteria bacterium RIFCSPHIGHO2_12_FULL_42_14]
MNPVHKFETAIGGKDLIVEVGRLAGQAAGSCTVQYGGTVILATVCLNPAIREGIDYFPLTVDFDEKLYAAGKIKGSRFIKREGRATDEAILAGRLIDRSIRPFFPEEIKNDVQVIASVLSFDGENDPDVISLTAAAIAISISPIPWHGPIAGVRVGRVNGEWVLNPSYEARSKSELDLIVSANKDRVVMLEAGGNEVPEEIMFEAIKFGQKHTQTVLQLIEKIITEVGQAKIDPMPKLTGEEKTSLDKINSKVKNYITTDKLKAIFTYQQKEELGKNITAAKEELDALLKADNEISKDERKKAVGSVDDFIDSHLRLLILEKGERPDGRKMDEIRQLSAEVGVLPRTHGSGLFQRGETQVLSIVTLGSPSMEQTLDTMEESSKKRYMHHYNFPPFSVGETGVLRGPGRREIGHGALAEKALVPMLPAKEDFPYTIRVVSEVLSSNGSSSQASICGSTLSLMDAGVPIKKPVAGIAMGLITDNNNIDKYRILTDIQGFEDHSGDMDFKIAGTADGITAVQMDTKIHGLTENIIKDALSQAKKARLEILATITKAIPAPRTELSPFAPRITTLHINPEKIRDVIGPGGKMINKIIAETGVNIDIEDDGSVFITALSPEGSIKAKEWIELLTAEVEVGKIYQGKVTRMFDFGAMVEYLPKQEGLIHVSEMAPFRVNTPEDIVHVGDEVPVKVVDIDEQGRINLSLKQTDFDYSGFTPPAVGSSRPFRPRGDDRRRPRF